MRKVVAGLAMAAVLACTSGAAAKTVKLVGMFSAEGTAGTHPTGIAHATLDTDTDTLSYKITYGGLSGPLLAASLHGPANSGAVAGMLVVLPAPYHDGMTGSVKLEPQAAQDLTQGRTYLNLTTKAQPTGEARAQMNVE